MTTSSFHIVIIIVSFGKYIAAGEMSGHIVGGQYSQVWQYPHSVNIQVDCLNTMGSCGASILNQGILLTAAHCFDDCDESSDTLAYMGNVREEKGFVSRVVKITIHYRYHSRKLENDIALLRLEKEAVFQKNIKRILLIRDPPYDEVAFIAGWGVIAPGKQVSIYLKHTSQIVYTRKECSALLGQDLPQGTFCGEHRSKLSYPESGDSGSALVVRDFIQIGLVSYSQPEISETITVYTDVGYYFDWIKEESRKLYCST